VRARLNMFMKKVSALNKQRYESDDDWDEDGDATGVSQGPSLSWQSIFCTLTNGENEDALETYLKCSNSYRVKRAGESKSVRDCYSEWDRAEFAWLKVEKRLRTILLKSLVSVEAQEFVTAVEALLLCLEARHQGTETESPVVPPTCAHLFASPPRLVKPSTTESVRCRESEGEDVVVSVAAPHLVVTLMDSAFHRLLLHATCQFHNMHSKSFNDKKRGGARATRISPFQSQKCRHTISLVPFVLLKLSTAEEENDKSKSKVKRTNKKNKDKANTSGNATSDVVVDQKSTECADVNTISLEDLTLEEKASTDGDAQVQNGEMPPVANGSSSVPRVENAADLGTESPSDGDNEDDSDDDEYCLVGLVSS
jgi:hypothetical protein